MIERSYYKFYKFIPSVMREKLASRNLSADLLRQSGGVEWMRASGGVWDTGGSVGDAWVKGFQLWVALPPSLELAETDSQYLSPADFQSVGPARVIAGAYGGLKSVIRAPEGMTYLD